MSDNNDAQNDNQNRESTVTPRSPMTVSEVLSASEDESHPRHAEARLQATDAAKNLAPPLKKYADSIASQVNVDEAMRQFRGQHNAALPQKFMDPALYELPAHQVVDIPKIDHTELIDGMKKAMQAKADRERRQDGTAEASLKTMQSVAAQIQQLNGKITEVEKRLKSGN